VTRIQPAGLVRAAVIFGALLALPFGIGQHWILNLLIFTLMYAALATAWNLVGGFSGYVSLGHALFFGIGAYAVEILFKHVSIGSGYRPFAVLPLVGLGVALVSIPIGLVAFRTRAATFAIVTISMLFAGQQLAYNLHDLTGGSQGIFMAVPPFPTATYERPFYYAMLAIFAFALLTGWYVRGSRLGLALRAIRDDEDRARGLGVQTMVSKLASLALSAGIVGMAGGVWAYYLTFIYPQFAFDPLVAIGMVLMVYLGGRGTVWGPALGAFILVPAQQYLAYQYGASELYLIGYAAVFLAVMLLMPRGILPTLADLRRRVRARGGPPVAARRAAADDLGGAAA
jgi:branched-chain amino acid transport system permease protein